MVCPPAEINIHGLYSWSKGIRSVFIEVNFCFTSQDQCLSANCVRLWCVLVYCRSQSTSKLTMTNMFSYFSAIVSSADIGDSNKSRGDSANRIRANRSCFVRLLINVDFFDPLFVR